MLPVTRAEGGAVQHMVAVAGPGRADAELRAHAEHVGGLLARRGATVVCGGLGGVMEAACRGARRAGGLTVGLLPGTDRAAANPYVDVAVPTGLGEARNVLVVRAADALIAVGGEYGTLTEIAFALKTGTPVVGLSTWELRKAGHRWDAFLEATDPVQAVEEALKMVGDRPTSLMDAD